MHGHELRQAAHLPHGKRKKTAREQRGVSRRTGVQPGALAPTASETQDVSYAPPSSAFRLVATVDPARTIEECDESDNVDTHASLIGCQLF